MDNNSLSHHGVLGQKWGVRRYQNKDGSLTPRGQRHRDRMEAKETKKKMSAQVERDLLNDALRREQEKKEKEKFVNPLSVKQVDLAKMSADEVAELSRKISAMANIKKQQREIIPKPEKSVVQKFIDSYVDKIGTNLVSEAAGSVNKIGKDVMEKTVKKLSEKIEIPGLSVETEEKKK